MVSFIVDYPLIPLEKVQESVLPIERMDYIKKYITKAWNHIYMHPMIVRSKEIEEAQDIDY
jgi:hypothetical protein